MKLAILAGTLAVGASVSCGGGGGDNPPTPPHDIGPVTLSSVKYDLKVDLTALTVNGTITGIADKAGDCVSLPSNIDVTLPTWQGKAADYTFVDKTAKFCGASVTSGSQVTLTYSSVIDKATWAGSQVGYSERNDAQGRKFHYLVSWVEGCSRFGPCDNRPATFAKYRFDVTHDPSLQVFCAGAISANTGNTVCDFAMPGGPTYSTYALMAYSAWQPKALGTWNNITIRGFEKSGGQVLDAIPEDVIGDFLQWMANKFGPYPYGNELRVLVAPTYWAGFEHPGNIVLDDTLNNTAAATHTMLHEIVHQWAGDQTTLAGRYDFVWKEAMAEYISYIYEEETNPTAAKQTRDGWKAGSNGAAYHPVPQDGPALFDFYGDVYGPGPMVLFRQIERMSSREQVIAAIASVLGKERTLSVAQLQTALEEKTGLDLELYFDAWILGSGAPQWPEISITNNTTETETQLTVTVQNSAPVKLGCKFDVELRGAEPTERERVSFNLFDAAGSLTAQTKTVTPAVPFVVNETVVDPDSECLVFKALPAAVAKPARAPYAYTAQQVLATYR